MQSTNLNVSPIFDDYTDEANYHRILFNAGKSVQARELTQAQTILQSQIERIGKHLFTEGAMVVPGGIRAIEAQDFVKLTLNSGSVFADFGSESDIFVKHSTSGMIYKIAKTFDAAGVDPVTLFVDFTTPGSNQEKKFLANDQVTIFAFNSNGTHRNLANATITSTGKGSWVKVQSGVYFVRGMFVRTDDQEFVVSKYTTDVSMKVGFRVVEEIITSAQDATLFSNANGFPNYNSSGASRLKITLILVGLAIGAVDKDFIEIARFDGGALSSKVDYTQYSIIEQSIARRTFETNGDFVVNQFGVDVKEHLKSGNNNGVYTVGAGGDTTKLVAAVRPGIGYVKGYRIENIGIQNVAFDKARDTAFLNNASYTADYGQYFLVNSVASLPDIDIKKKILLLDSGNVQVGTARVRALRRDGSSVRVYVFDISMNTGKTITNVNSIKYTDASSLFTATLVSSTLFDSNKSSLVFKLPIASVKSLYQSGVGGDTSYTVLRSFNLTTNGSGIVSASVGSNEFFGPVDTTSWFIALTGSASAGTQFDPSATVVLGGTIAGTTMTINLGSGQANKSIKVIAPVLKSQTTQKNKTLLTITDEVINFPNTNRQAFSKADIYDIVSVKDNSTNEDLTSLFTFDNGQKDSWYENGKLMPIDITPIIRTVKVTYRYFAHSAGDYFTVDSYTGLTREQIPSYNGANLADYIDFRPLKDAAGDFTSSTVFGEILKPGDSVRADITYYLPRNDILAVTSTGEFKVVKGIPSLSPSTPETPADSMKLYELYIPAYTESANLVTVKTVDNKRYTMRDIGRLDSRISNLEYFTTLTALETNTNKTEVIDPVTGNNRFKNGFAVDGFTDYRLSDLTNQEWSASLDLANKLLMPSFAQHESGFTTNSLTNVVKPKRVFMMSYSHEKIVEQPYATMTINVNPYAVFSWVGDVALTPDRDFWKDVIYNEPVVINNTVNLRGDAVEGVVWSGWIKTTYDELGGHRDWARQQFKQVAYQTTFQEQSYSTTQDSVVSTQVVPYMRSTLIKAELTGFRPFTRLYPFWDSVDVSAESRPLGGAYGDPIVTNSNGSITVEYLVPNRADKKFKTGESVFRFSDSAADSRDPNVLTTWGSQTFTSGGVTETRQTTTTNTKVLTASTSQVAGSVRYLDPIAQTFIVPTDGGGFVTKFDIFFETKARSIPVTLELRTAANGLPSSEVIGRVTLNPDQVNISADATAATTFTFDDPIYLEDGREYAIVLVANTQEYNVFIAEQGQNIIGSQMALSKQAYMGVFLTSSNSSTWTPHQNRDMKFALYKAAFNIGTSSQVVFDANAPVALPLSNNAINTTSGSSIVRVKQPSHGLLAGDTVVIAGAVTGNGISATNLNGTKTVINTDIDSFTYQAGSTNANATGAIGGSALTAVMNYPFNILVNNVESFAPNGTSVKWEYQYKSQATRVASGWIAMDPKSNTTLPSEAVLRAVGDLQIRATLTSSRSDVSPVIESSGFNAVMVSPRVDPSTKVFTYVTQDVKFNNPTAHAKFLVGARLPGNSGMKLYVKKLDTSDQDVSTISWVELVPTNPIANSESYVEYEYLMNGNFIGYKVKIEFTGSRDNPPNASDFRTLAFA